MADENLLKMAEQKFQSAAEKIANDMIATCHKQPQTNADRIRAMSDEELVELVGKYVYCGLCPLKHRCVAGECNKTVMKWLKQPAEDSKYEQEN